MKLNEPRKAEFSDPRATPRATFAAALWDLPGNGLLHREWRSLLRPVRGRGWRQGGRLLRDLRAWGLPVLAILPYFIYWALALLSALRGNAPGIVGAIDVFRSALALLPLYLAGVTTALLAPAIAGERERKTWETLRATALSGHDLLLGYLAGRLGPLLAGFGLVALVWVLARQHYAPLLQLYAPFLFSKADLLHYSVERAARLISSGTLALAVSAWSRQTTRAVVGALLLACLLQFDKGILQAAGSMLGHSPLGQALWRVGHFGTFGWLAESLPSSSMVDESLRQDAVWLHSLDHLLIAAISYKVGWLGIKRF